MQINDEDLWQHILAMSQAHRGAPSLIEWLFSAGLLLGVMPTAIATAPTPTARMETT